MPYARPSGLDKTMPDALELGSPTDDRSWKYSEAGVETMPGVLAIACNVVDPFPDCISIFGQGPLVRRGPRSTPGLITPGGPSADGS